MSGKKRRNPRTIHTGAFGQFQRDMQGCGSLGERHGLINRPPGIHLSRKRADKHVTRAVGGNDIH